MLLYFLYTWVSFRFCVIIGCAINNKKTQKQLQQICLLALWKSLLNIGGEWPILQAYIFCCISQCCLLLIYDKWSFSSSHNGRNLTMQRHTWNLNIRSPPRNTLMHVFSHFKFLSAIIIPNGAGFSMWIKGFTLAAAALESLNCLYI